MKKLLTWVFLTFGAHAAQAQVDEDALRHQATTTVCTEIRKVATADGTCDIAESDWDFTSYTVRFSMAGSSTRKAASRTINTQKHWDSVASSYAFQGSISCHLDKFSGWSCTPDVQPFVVKVQTKACHCNVGDIISLFAPCIGPSYCAKVPVETQADGLSVISFNAIGDSIPKLTNGFLQVRPR